VLVQPFWHRTGGECLLCACAAQHDAAWPLSRLPLAVMGVSWCTSVFEQDNGVESI
jgi:hypothetical protein